jgi:hypothetical protein
VPELATQFFKFRGGRLIGLNTLGRIVIFAPIGQLLLAVSRPVDERRSGPGCYWAVTVLMDVSQSLLLYTGVRSPARLWSLQPPSVQT